jgi:hypothetical protein
VKIVIYFLKVRDYANFEIFKSPVVVVAHTYMSVVAKK